MVRTRTGWLVAVVALSLGIGGCKKKEETKAAAGSAAATEKPSTDKPATPPAPAASSPSGDDLALLPADSEMVMGLNFAQLQQSALWKEFSPKLMEAA